MEAQKAINEIKTFRNTYHQLLKGANDSDGVKEEYEGMPQHILDYISQIVPSSNNVLFDLTGDPFCLLAAQELIEKRNELVYEYELEGSSWSNEWMIIGYQMWDPFCLSLSKDETKVFRFSYNGELGNPVPVADNIGQFLLCAYAMDYAINEFENSIIVEDNSFDIELAAAPAKWLFPKMKEWAGDYYEEWCDVFENYKL